MANLIQLNINGPEYRFNPLENPSVSLGNLSAVWSWINNNEPSAAGELIDHETALKVISVYSCVRIISSTIGSLPLKLYARLPKGREEAIDNALYDILTVSPNPEMNGVVFWTSVSGNMALTGNSYVYIQRVAGQVEALWILNPNKTKPVRLPNGELAYQCNEGIASGQSRIYNKEDILHFKLYSLDGLHGLSPIMLAREGLGISRAAEKMTGRLLSNNGLPGGVLKVEGNMDQKVLLNLRESWQAAQTGSNTFKTAVLPSNMSYTPTTLNLESMEFLKSRAFQRSEIAALFGIPGHMLGDETKLSATSSEQEALSLVTFTLRPYLQQIECEIQRVLLPTTGRNANKFFVQFSVAEMLRGDAKSKNEAYQIGRLGGWLSSNDILEDIGENPIGKIGDIYLCPVNYTNLENMIVKPEPAPVPATPTPEPTEQPQQPDTPPDPKQPIEEDPTEDIRSITKRASTLTLVFKDALGRLMKRDNRTLETITTVFDASLRSIVALSIDHASKQLGIEWRYQHEEDNLVSAVCKGIEKRSGKWTPEHLDEITAEEFRKVVKHIVAAVYQQLGAASVTTE